MNDVDIKLIGDNELAEALRSLDYATQQRELKKILRDAANKTVVAHLKRVAPVRTGALRASMGVITGKSKRKATVFAGPRLSHSKTRSGKAGYSGWVANILENAKPQRRVPQKGKAFKPFFGTASGPGFVTSVGPITKKTHFTYAIQTQLQPAALHITKSTRTVLTRTWNRKRKIMTYGEAKGR